jgi:hypothetical protein
MSDDKKADRKTPKSDSTDRQGRSRRDFVKKLAAGGAVAAGASQMIPKKWAKPVIDAVVIPVHAQSSLGNLAPRWVLGDDAPGGLAGITTGTTSASDFLYDDGTDMAFTAVLTPPAAVPVTINVNQTGTTYGGDDFGTLTATANGTTGLATFGTFYPPNDDFGDNPGTGSIVVTFSAPGYGSKVITLNLTSGGAPRPPAPSGQRMRKPK